MQTKKVNAKLLWIQFEDVLAPRLGLTVWDRAVYSYLLRHSLVVGKFRLHFAVMDVARDLGLSNGPVRQAVRRLDELGALRLLERSKAGHLVEMRLPEEIPAVRPGDKGASRAAEEPPASALEGTDFLKTWALRKAIHDRERGVCFYCLRRTPAYVQCLDHVVPRALSGRNSYRNLVSCCMECNFHKGDRPAPDHLRDLYRQGRLTPAELTAQLSRLQDLAAGKLRPRVSDLENTGTEVARKQQRPTTPLHKASGWRGTHRGFASRDEAPIQAKTKRASPATLQVFLDEAGAEVNVELHQRRIANRLEAVNLTGLDDEDVSRAALEGLAVDGPHSPAFPNELDLVIRVAVRTRSRTGLPPRTWLTMKHEHRNAGVALLRSAKLKGTTDKWQILLAHVMHS